MPLEPARSYWMVTYTAIVRLIQRESRTLAAFFNSLLPIDATTN
jgi:hypothetical protein